MYVIYYEAMMTSIDGFDVLRLAQRSHPSSAHQNPPILPPRPQPGKGSGLCHQPQEWGLHLHLPRPECLNLSRTVAQLWTSELHCLSTTCTSSHSNPVIANYHLRLALLQMVPERATAPQYRQAQHTHMHLKCLSIALRT